MKKIYFFAVFVLSTFFAQAQQNTTPTLSAGLDHVTFKQGTLNVELIAKIISEKQQELIREGIKRMIFEVIGDSRLDDYSQFYIERITEILFQEKNHKVMTKRILEESTNYLFVLGTTKLLLDNKNAEIKTTLEGILSTTYNSLPKKLSKINDLEIRNRLIKLVLTICSEIPEIKKLGLFNSFNYYEHFEIQEKKIFNEFIEDFKNLKEINFKTLKETLKKDEIKKSISLIKNNLKINEYDFKIINSEISSTKKQVYKQINSLEHKIKEIKKSIKVLKKNKDINEIENLIESQKKYCAKLKEDVETLKDGLNTKIKKVKNYYFDSTNTEHENKEILDTQLIFLKKQLFSEIDSKRKITKDLIKLLIKKGLLNDKKIDDLKKIIASLENIDKIKDFISHLIGKSNVIKDILNKSGIEFTTQRHNSLTNLVSKFEGYKPQDFINKFKLTSDNDVTSYKNFETQVSNIKSKIDSINSYHNSNILNTKAREIKTGLNKIKFLNEIKSINQNYGINLNIYKNKLKLSKDDLRKLKNVPIFEDIDSLEVNNINKDKGYIILNKEKSYLLDKFIESKLNGFMKLVKSEKNYFNIANQEIEIDTSNIKNKKLKSEFILQKTNYKNFLSENSEIVKIKTEYEIYRKLYKLVQLINDNKNFLSEYKKKNNNLKKDDNIVIDLAFKLLDRNQQRLKYLQKIEDLAPLETNDKIKVLEKYFNEYFKGKNESFEELTSIYQISKDLINTIEKAKNSFFVNKITTSVSDSNSSQILFSFIQEHIKSSPIKPKDGVVFSLKDEETIKKLYSYFIDRNLNKKIKNIDIINFFNEDFKSDLLLLSNKVKDASQIKKIINSVELSISSLLNNEIKNDRNREIFINMDVKEIESFLKFIGNIKELNKAETFAFLLKTMNDYGYLFANANGNRKLIPDLINSLRQYAIIDLEHNLIEIDVASVLTHMLEKYQKEKNWSFYATVGLNQYWIPNYKSKNSNTTYGAFNAASEKIGVKYKIFNFDRNFLDEDKLIHKVKKKSLVSDIYAMGYVTGILYKIANTSGENYNYANIGVATGLTFFNSLDFNVSVSIPFAKKPFENYVVGFSFDIPLSEYLKRLKL